MTRGPLTSCPIPLDNRAEQRGGSAQSSEQETQVSQDERRPGEIVSGDAGDVTTGEVTIRQGGARSVEARDVAIRQGGAVRVNAEEVEITQGGVVFATARELEVTAGGVVAAIADTAELDQSWAQMVIARESVDMDQAASVLVVSKSTHARDSLIGLVLAREFRGDSVRVLMGPRAALAFGAGLGLALGLLALFRGRR
jgi:hypothetical protein